VNSKQQVLQPRMRVKRKQC